MQRYKQKQPDLVVEAFRQQFIDAKYDVFVEDNGSSRNITMHVPVGYWLVKETFTNGKNYKISWYSLSNEEFNSRYEPIETAKQKNEKIYPTSEDLKRLEDIAKRQQLEEYLKQKERNVPHPWNGIPVDPWVIPHVPGTRFGFRDGQFWHFWTY